MREFLPQLGGEKKARVRSHSREPLLGVGGTHGMVEGSVDLDGVEKLREVGGLVKSTGTRRRIDDAVPIGVRPSGRADEYASELLGVGAGFLWSSEHRLEPHQAAIADYDAGSREVNSRAYAWMDAFMRGNGSFALVGAKVALCGTRRYPESASTPMTLPLADQFDAGGPHENFLQPRARRFPRIY